MFVLMMMMMLYVCFDDDDDDDDDSCAKASGVYCGFSGSDSTVGLGVKWIWQ